MSDPRARAALVVARREILDLSRDGRFRALGAAVVGLLVVGLAFGARQAEVTRIERADATRAAERHWREQDDKNPHVAAHYGKHVFKPAGVLSFVDPGVEPYLGVSVKLEAHRRNALVGARARDGTGLSRFGRLSAAAVLQLLVPLLVVGLGFAAWTSERERGTLRLLASQGVPPRRLLLGKVLGLSAGLGAALVPALAVGAAAAAWLGGAGGDPGTPARLAALALAFLIYFVVWIFVTLAASARAASSRSALVGLLALWVATALIVPRAATDVAARFAPVPSAHELQGAVARSLAEGVPGSGEREERVAAITETILERQGFAGAETLMDASLLQGIELQAEAAFENEVLDHHHGAYAAALARQEALVGWAALASPVLAMRSISAGLAGTDLAHHRHFERAAEEHRRALIDMLNRDFAERAGTAGWDYRAGAELWERAPVFAYAPPSVGWALGSHAASLASLALWLLVAAFAATRAVRLEAP